MSKRILQIPSMVYMTLYGAIPSKKANGVGIMNLCNQLAVNGIDVELVLPLEKGKNKRLLSGQNLWQFYDIPCTFKITYLPFFPFGIAFKHVVFPIYAICYSLFRGKSAIYARHIEFAYLAALLGKISIFESHNYQKVKSHPLLKRWIKIMGQKPQKTGMVVTTQAGAKAYEEMGVSQKSLLIAPNGVALERFSKFASKKEMRKTVGLPSERTMVVFSGHLYEGRGIEELLECAGMLKALYFVIVGGEPKDLDRCKTLARRLKLKNIKFVGFVQQSNLPRYLLASDILVMPYTRATLTHRYMSPMKMFEYLASGRPIVATDFPVIREILHDKKNAVLVPPDSGHALASGIQWLLDNPDHAKKLGDNARKDAEKYSWENRGSRIASWLRSMFFTSTAS